MGRNLHRNTTQKIEFIGQDYSAHKRNSMNPSLLGQSGFGAEFYESLWLRSIR